MEGRFPSGAADDDKSNPESLYVCDLYLHMCDRAQGGRSWGRSTIRGLWLSLRSSRWSDGGVSTQPVFMKNY